jgi:hypothetical protein
MPPMQRSGPYYVPALALLAMTFAAGIMARHLILSPKETWLEVEAPSVAARGKAYTVVVRLKEPPRGAFLQVDLHGQDSSRRYLGFASATAAAKLVPGQAEYLFELTIPPGGDLAYVQGVIYLSRRGSWESRGAMARLDPVPIASGLPSEGELRPRPVPAYPISDRFEPPREDSFPFQVLTALAWAACALLSLERSHDPRSAAMAVACLAACLWELLMPDTAISDLFRRASKSEGLYYFRRRPQVLVSLTVIAVALSGACLILIRSIKAGRTARGTAWLGLYAYAGTALLRIISEHDVDALFAVSVAGIQAGQAARLCCAFLCLSALAIGAARSGRPPSRRPRRRGPWS